MPAPPETQTEWAVGHRLHVVGRAIRGGSADVARVVEGGAHWALKVGRAPSDAPRLADEARTAVLAGAPNVPGVHWAGWVRPAEGGYVVSEAVEDALPALALEWVEGASLLGDAPLDPGRVVHDVATALAALHAAGYAHGDVSRANVMFDGARGHLVDLGLSCPVGTPTPTGATLRYLDVRGKLGDARARDLLAFGIVVCELVAPEIRAATDENVLDVARGWAASPSASRAGTLADVARALLCPEPAVRPDASWVAAMTRWGDAGRAETSPVRAAYLRAREHELAGSPTDAQPVWLEATVKRLAAVDSLAGRATSSKRALAPLDALGMSRWLVGLVGPAAVDWPVDRLLAAGERRVDEALRRLAEERDPASWTLDRVEHELGGSTVRHGQEPRDRDSEIAHLALALSRIPADADAIVAIERDATLPPALALAAADALRLGGEAARARQLSRRAREQGCADPLEAEIERRAGDRTAARALASAMLEGGGPPRARAILARLALDEGDVGGARGALRGGEGAACEEVAVLCAAVTNDVHAAREAARRGRALARTSEERARISGALAYALAESAPGEALAAYREAADHAARAGAVEEEATYRTGEAATAASEGRLEEAVAAGTRAALLWEARRRPERAARAFLACASALATVGRVDESARFADLATSRARDGRDARTVLFAELARHDAVVAARGKAEPVRTAATSPSDELRVAARGGGALHVASDERARLDALARDTTSDVGARLDWWGARATALLDHDAAERADEVVTSLVELSASPAPVEAKGAALTAGFRLASRRSLGDAGARLALGARAAARALVERAGPTLGAAAREVPWVAVWLAPGAADDAASGLESVGEEQARELLRVVRALEGRERLGDLLDRIVDALVAWTGVERGLLLLPSADGVLRPRAARRLGRDDLRGDQLALSQTLARRALEAGEPVVAVDAAGEMSDVHASVHALRLRSVLAVPLIARGEVLGVVYLDDRVRRGAFGPRELAWARTVAALAAMVLAEARERVLLRREARRARRAREQLAEELAERDAMLSVAEAQLGERSRRGIFGEIIGESAALTRVVRVAERVARSEVPVLILGESGSGKELFARAIHEAGSRRKGPFVSENCSAIPEPLLESTLFGHERGAFTGADRAKGGLLHAADGGTLFLDEVGEMSLAMQAKMLRVLEDGLVRPVGGTRARKVDVRIIAATHRDLEAMVEERTFREDLYYRLHIVVLSIPPLRERRDDVPLLVRTLLARHAAGRSVRVSRAAMDRLCAFDWPGNVRQLENEIRRALVLADDDLDVEHLSDAVAGTAGDALAAGSASGTLRGRIDALETTLVREALSETGGNLTRAAKELGVSRFGLQKMLKRLAIDRPAADAAPLPKSAARAKRVRR